VSVQAIQEDGERMGALVTLRDLGLAGEHQTQLPSERAAGGVGAHHRRRAHEVRITEFDAAVAGKLEGITPGGGRRRVAASSASTRQGDRPAGRVVKRFLDFHAPDSRLEATQLAELLRKVLESRAAPALEVQHPTRLSSWIDVPELYVDRALLKAGGAESGAECREAIASGGQLRRGFEPARRSGEITVGDTGKGISAENRQKIFQCFFHHASGSSGIGLASTFRIVQLLNVR